MKDHVRKKIQTFFSDYKPNILQKNDIFIEAGEEPTGIYYLTEGVVKEYAISKKGEEVIVNIFKPFSFFPMSWGINQTPNRYFYEAVTMITVHKAPREDIIALLKNHPDITYDLLGRVYRGTDGVLMKMVSLMSAGAYNRIITDLLIYTKRLGEWDKEQNRYIIPLSEKHLANLTGLARETISREMKILKQKNLVEIKRNSITILDIQKLEDELSENY